MVEFFSASGPAGQMAEKLNEIRAEIPVAYFDYLVLPEFSPFTAFVTVSCLALLPIVFMGEGYGFVQLGYSKFARGSSILQVSSQLGMMIIYTPALMISTYWMYHVINEHNSPWETVLNGPSLGGNIRYCEVRGAAMSYMIIIHFLKRCIEVMFVHVYSGNTDLMTSLFISLVYSFETLWLVANNTQVPSANCGVKEEHRFYVIAGMIVYSLGLLGNGWHHIILRQMRTAKGDESEAMGKSQTKKTTTKGRKPAKGKKAAGTAEKDAGVSKEYVVPMGGLFDYVCCPHYLCELGIWLGMAIYSGHVQNYIVFLVMVGYLGGRSVATERWYRHKMGDKYPKNRKRLLPLIF
eukprot:Clim_evm43s202 gene=Clim_evmTU43s202